MRCPPLLIAVLSRLLPIVVLGLAIGVACWPLNLLDRAQDQLLQLLPGFEGGGWRPLTVAMACAPLLVMPVLLVASQYVSQKIVSPKSDDPQQQQTQAILGFIPFMIGGWAGQTGQSAE